MWNVSEHLSYFENAEPLTGVRKLEATKWYRAGFASLTSHAAGIVGFVGFQKIVVARCGGAGWSGELYRWAMMSQ